jgi:NAD(P)-dependent dehydrogenase (short-subunit alcohol dehydrogenase family)
VTAGLLRFDGAHAVVVGGASGIGAAAAELLAELGAAVTVLDRAEAEGTAWIPMDLRQRASIDAAAAACPGPIEVLLCCAGVADGTPGLPTINFVGQRHLIETVIAAGAMAAGSAIGMVASTAALTWEAQLPRLLELIETPDFESGERWFEAHPEFTGYRWSKMAVSAYVARQAFPFAQKGIRINATLPGQTDTPLAQANADLWLRGYEAEYREAANIPVAAPRDQAYPLLFLCSRAASRLNGVNLVTDAGYHSAGLTGAYDAPGIQERLAIMKHLTTGR